MLDDSLTTGIVERTSIPESSSQTVGDSRESPGTRGAERDVERTLGIGERFAGFVVRGFLGRGAMGVVYDAWDPTLERRVALKLLRSPTRRAAERLLREARALARLDHPNVVRIWAADVHRGAVFIAMELVEGQNLREWMKTRRSWSEALPVMLGAARGLAAAHAARVIHRDFKPENVLVGWDGQARVLDFGIARISAQHPDHLSSTIDSGFTHDGEGEAHCGSAALSGSFAGVPVEQGVDAALTEAGALIGTLLYMAPEQHERERADERSDQFAFCVSLFEALYGSHPFPAKNVSDLILRVATGKIEFPDDDRSRVPRWLERVILKGLSRDRNDRFASMDELIDALERHPRRRRARNRVMAAAAVVAGAVALGVMVPRAEPPDPCAEVGSELDGVLGEAQRRAISERFASVEEPWADELGARVDAALGAWAGRWIEARHEVCELRHGHAEATVVDTRREACLTEQLAGAAALGEVLTGAKRRVLGNAERALIALPDPSECLGEDPPVGHAPGTPDALTSELRELGWLAMTGSDARSTLERARALVEDIRALPSNDANLSLLAEGLEILAEVELVAGGSTQTAEALLHESIRAAERTASDVVRARAVVALGWLLATSPGRTQEAQRLLEDAAALVERVGSPRNESIRLQQALAEARLANGDVAGARALFEAVLAEVGDSRDIHFTTLLGLSRVAEAEQDHARALAYAQQALALIERRGESDYRAAPLNNIGDALVDLGRYDEARAPIEEAVALRRDQLRREASEGNRRRLGESLLNLANLDSTTGRAEAAHDAYLEVLALLPEQDYANRSLALFNLGVDHQFAGRTHQALASYEQALQDAARVLPAEHRYVVGARLGVGSMLVELGRPLEARAPLERCLIDLPKAMQGGYDEAELKFALARALVDAADQRERSEALARAAEQLYRKLGEAAQADGIAAWLEANFE